MATAYDAYLPYVLPETPGCPEIVAIQAIRNAVIEFCEKSLLLQRDHDPISTVAEVSDYDFDPPTGYLVTKLMRAWYQRTELKVLAPDNVADPAIYNALGNKALSGNPISLAQKDEVTFTLYPVPQYSVANAVTMRVALKPTRASVAAEDILFENWAETIAAGAKYRICATPNKGYTNPQSAAINNALFVQGLNRAMLTGNRGHARANLQVRMRKI